MGDWKIDGGGVGGGGRHGGLKPSLNLSFLLGFDPGGTPEQQILNVNYIYIKQMTDFNDDGSFLNQGNNSAMFHFLQISSPAVKLCLLPSFFHFIR